MYIYKGYLSAVFFPVVSLLLSFESSLCILYTSHLLEMQFGDIFFHPMTESF